MARTSSLYRAALLVTLTACGSTVVENNGPPTSTPAPTEPGPTPAVADAVTIDEIAVYQSVKVTMTKGGAVSKPNAPLIAGRPALVRAHVTPTDRKVRKLVAELRVKRAGKDDLVVRD